MDVSVLNYMHNGGTNATMVMGISVSNLIVSQPMGFDIEIC